MKEQIQAYIEENKQRFLDELFEFIKIPSVSTDKEFSDDVFEAAEWLKNKLEEAGAENCEVIMTDGYPLVYGEKIINPELPTALIYGHYDVQPADPYELWDNPPFEPIIKDDKIYARGSCDDKGQVFMHVKAFEFLSRTGQLPCNVKFLIEGEEEVGSHNLEIYIENNKDKIKADFVLLSDTSMLANDTPSITIGIRGLSYIEVEVTGPNRDLHSGVYGGAVANPANVLAEMIGKLIDEKGKILIPGFYDNVEPISPQEKEQINKVPFNDEEMRKDLNVNELFGEEGYSAYERTSYRPSCDVNGIWGGYIKKGAKTVLPSKASAKISCRLVPNQTDDEITKKLTDYIYSIAPNYVKIKVTALHGGNPVVVPIDSDEYRAASKAFEETFGKTPLPVRSGGSIPIVALFESALGLKSIMMGFGLDSDDIHSPNEHYGLFNFFRGIETIPLFYKHLMEMKG